VRDADRLNGTGEDPVAFTYKDGVRAYTVTKRSMGVAAANLHALAGDRQCLGARGDVALPGREALCRV